jgi:hypothetical protein
MGERLGKPEAGSLGYGKIFVAAGRGFASSIHCSRRRMVVARGGAGYVVFTSSKIHTQDRNRRGSFLGDSEQRSKARASYVCALELASRHESMYYDGI